MHVNIRSVTKAHIHSPKSQAYHSCNSRSHIPSTPTAAVEDQSATTAMPTTHSHPLSQARSQTICRHPSTPQKTQHHQNNPHTPQSSHAPFTQSTLPHSINTYSSRCKLVSDDSDVDKALAPTEPNSFPDNLPPKEYTSTYTASTKSTCTPHDSTHVNIPTNIAQSPLNHSINTYSSCCRPVSDDRDVDSALAPAEPIPFPNNLPPTEYTSTDTASREQHQDNSAL